MMRKAFLLGIPFAFLVVACTYDNGDSHPYLDPNDSSSCGDPTTQSTIDVDRALEIDQGEGAGIYIEYAAGGHWHVQTSCDTLKSNTGCDWDVIVTPEKGSSIFHAAPENLTGDDSLQTFPPDSYRLIAHTTTELDGLTFDSDPGASISVDALLDDACALPYFFWVGGGALHSGSPSNPITLVPSAN